MIMLHSNSFRVHQDNIQFRRTKSVSKHSHTVEHTNHGYHSHHLRTRTINQYHWWFTHIDKNTHWWPRQSPLPAMIDYRVKEVMPESVRFRFVHADPQVNWISDNIFLRASRLAGTACPTHVRRSTPISSWSMSGEVKGRNGEEK